MPGLSRQRRNRDNTFPAAALTNQVVSREVQQEIEHWLTELEDVLMDVVITPA
ncbi:MAG: hypothetical protein AAGC71_17730 [Pseudomonadota bacterium]